jgi:hypothetical protein
MKKNTSSRSAFFKVRVAASLLLAAGGVALGFAAFSRVTAQSPSKDTPQKISAPEAQYRGIAPVVQSDVSPPLRDMVPILDPGKRRPNEERDAIPRSAGFIHETDPVVQATATTGDAATIAPPQISFDAQSGTASPPDPVMAVGPNHIITMANSTFQILTKNGTSVFGPAAINTLFSGFGGACQTENAGDPVVVHDQLADRWIMMQFTAAGPTYFNCVAVSTTSDPTGTYTRYAISTGSNFPDYPKMSLWPDAYYISTREFAGNTFAGIGAYALNRQQALAGNPNAQVISFVVPPGTMPFNTGDGLLPADLDGQTLPPAGSPNYFVGTMDNNHPYGAPQDAITLWKFTANFANPPASSFVLANTIPVAPFNSILGLCGGTRACIPQAGSTLRLDHLGYRQRPTFRLAYRNFGTHESLVTSQSVSGGTGPNGEVSGMRWYELRSPNSSPFVHQQGTYAPGVTDGIHRWMGSIAMDGNGNMGLGYSAANNTNPALFPSIYYTGRNAGSPLGTMPLGEAAIFTGTSAAAPLSSRWGDYTAIDVDPVDDTTFWYVNEYYPSNTTTWRLRVGSFKLIPSAFPTAATATLTSESCSPANSVPDPGERVSMSLCVTNSGDLATTNTVGTLQTTGGITDPSAPQSYGSIAPGATVCRTFTFTASGSCGGRITPSLQLQDGSTNFGTVAYSSFPLGTLSNSFAEAFDGVTAPALPSGWTADQGTNAGGSPLWVTSSSGNPAPPANSAPNAAFTPDPATLLDNRLVSPIFNYATGSRLTFRHNYDLESSGTTSAWDCGVLEMSVNGGAWQDILAAGGTFAEGGYNRTALQTANPLGVSRPNWSGNSGGFVTTVVNLPQANAGQNVQMRWRMTSDNSVARTGWRVDNVAINIPVCSTNCSLVPSAAVSRKTHGSAGTFDVPLPLTGTVATEPRRGGGTGQSDHTIVLTFGTPVTVNGTPQAQVISGTGTIGSNGASNGGAVTVSGSSITIPLTNVANAQVISVRVNGVNNGSSTGDVVIPMGMLLGDSNNDRIVNTGDALQTRSRSGQTADGTNFRSDANPDGLIGAGDTIIVRGQSGNSIP